MYTKKEKGNIGLAKTMAELTVQKIHASVPIEEDLPYDVIGEVEGVCKRIQARYCTPDNGVLKVKLKSVWSDKKGNHIRNREQGDFDILAIYCPTTDKVYFVNDSEFENSANLHLRLTEQKKKNQYQTRMAKDYLDCKRIWRDD